MIGTVFVFTNLFCVQKYVSKCVNCFMPAFPFMWINTPIEPFCECFSCDFVCSKISVLLLIIEAYELVFLLLLKISGCNLLVVMT